MGPPPHVDKANIGYYDYSAVLYMTTMGVGCEGGQLVFADPDGDEVIEPRAGRCVLFASGTEHLHQVQPVTNTECGYGIRSWPQNIDMECGYGNRNTELAPKYGYGYGIQGMDFTYGHPHFQNGNLVCQSLKSIIDRISKESETIHTANANIQKFYIGYKKNYVYESCSPVGTYHPLYMPKLLDKLMALPNPPQHSEKGELQLKILFLEVCVNIGEPPYSLCEWLNKLVKDACVNMCQHRQTSAALIIV